MVPATVKSPNDRWREKFMAAQNAMDAQDDETVVIQVLVVGNDFYAYQQENVPREYPTRFGMSYYSPVISPDRLIASGKIPSNTGSKWKELCKSRINQHLENTYVPAQPFLISGSGIRMFWYEVNNIDISRRIAWIKQKISQGHMPHLIFPQGSEITFRYEWLFPENPTLENFAVWAELVDTDVESGEVDFWVDDSSYNNFTPKLFVHTPGNHRFAIYIDSTYSENWAYGDPLQVYQEVRVLE